jgi:hypothetical protein
LDGRGPAHDAGESGFQPLENTMKRILSALSLLLALSACSSMSKQTDAEKLALYRSYAGAPVGDFQYFGRLNGWSPLGDSALVVWTKPNQAYLLDLFGPCTDLDYAPAISLSNLSSRVSARFDKVYVLGGGGGSFRIPCRIETIRPLDVKALKQAQREMREAKMVEREAGAG